MVLRADGEISAAVQPCCTIPLAGKCVHKAIPLTDQGQATQNKQNQGILGYIVIRDYQISKITFLMYMGLKSEPGESVM